jgi:hypothetical protein
VGFDVMFEYSTSSLVGVSEPEPDADGEYVAWIGESDPLEVSKASPVRSVPNWNDRK